jgi:hypothetical protein
MAELTPLITAWIRFAEEDWDDAQILARSGGKLRSICFHCQQCIEKLFKAELMRLQATVPKTIICVSSLSCCIRPMTPGKPQASTSIASLWQPSICGTPIPTYPNLRLILLW